MIVYISGPMTGYEDLNFPEFEKAADRLRQQGHVVISPHEIDQPVKTWEACMKEDIKQLMRCSTVAVLPGWEQSKGARIEVELARSLGMRIIHAETLDEIAS